jgi:hypothetical protein
MKKPAQHLIAEIPRRQPRVAMTIGIELGDVWSHYCTLNQDGEVVDRGRFRTTPKAIEKWFTDVAPARVAMEAGTHLIWISEQLQELGHEVIVANVRELRAISHSDRKSDQVDAEKLDGGFVVVCVTALDQLPPATYAASHVILPGHVAHPGLQLPASVHSRDTSGALGHRSCPTQAKEGLNGPPANSWGINTMPLVFLRARRQF